MDRDTLPPDDLRKIGELLRHRPIQFAMFLKALFGAEAMEKIMNGAINSAKQAPKLFQAVARNQ